MIRFLACALWLVSLCATSYAQQWPEVLPGTERLPDASDLASDMIDGIDRFLLRQLDKTPELRKQAWPRPSSQSSLSLEDQWSQIVAQQRKVHQRIIGLRDQRLTPPTLWTERALQYAKSYASSKQWSSELARWTIFQNVDGRGILVQPARGIPIRFQAIVIPDAGQTPEHMIGVAVDQANVAPIASMLASVGGQVIVVSPVSRHREARRGRAVLTDQEFIYRSAFELGRHLLGYQVHEVLAAVDALPKQEAKAKSLPLMVVGWGEGGWIALHAAAADPRIQAVCVSGHFDAREKMWQEPIHRNLQGILNEFGDAELAAMIAPNHLVIDAVPGPQVTIPGDGGAPGQLTGPEKSNAQREYERAASLLAPWHLSDRLHWIESTAASAEPTRPGPSIAGLRECFKVLNLECTLSEDSLRALEPEFKPGDALVSAEARRQEPLQKWDRFSQYLLEQSSVERAAYWKDLKTDSLENFKTTVESYRDKFRDEVIGWWHMKPNEAHPRSRRIYDEPKWVGYEVKLDVFDDVFASGVLLLPRDMRPNEHRPCVVFQHGLEGRPKDCIEGDHPAYHNVAARLAEEGFVVFAPQNPYIFKDRFRTLQRKNNPVGKTLFSTIIPQHQQICRWLASLPQVDAKRIAFYGLSYGGKSAMRIPPLVPEYSLSICSADFNDWVWKNASTNNNYSYMFTMEYEIFEFDLGSRFNYSEMATLIAPRPFMVERGHFDGVAPDDRVASEFAKVQHLYSAKLGLKNEARLEWFTGPHTIHGQGTFALLREKLKPQK